jgi:transporter family-2 protein
MWAMSSPPAPRFIHYLGAFAAGGLISLMLLTNGTLAQYGTLLFSSWVPHLTGTVLAIAILLALKPARATHEHPPLWAYLGGVSGGLTVIATSAAMNSALALSGTIALGLAGQIVFSLFADARGLFGLPQRMPGWRDFAGLTLISAGALVLIFFGAAP